MLHLMVSTILWFKMKLTHKFYDHFWQLLHVHFSQNWVSEAHLSCLMVLNLKWFKSDTKFKFPFFLWFSTPKKFHNRFDNVLHSSTCTTVVYRFSHQVGTKARSSLSCIVTLFPPGPASSMGDTMGPNILWNSLGFLHS